MNNLKKYTLLLGLNFTSMGLYGAQTPGSNNAMPNTSTTNEVAGTIRISDLQALMSVVEQISKKNHEAMIGMMKEQADQNTKRAQEEAKEQIKKDKKNRKAKRNLRREGYKKDLRLKKRDEEIKRLEKINRDTNASTALGWGAVGSAVLGVGLAIAAPPAAAGYALASAGIGVGGGIALGGASLAKTADATKTSWEGQITINESEIDREAKLIYPSSDEE